MLGVYIGYLAVVMLINAVLNKRITYLLKTVGIIFLGAATASAPVLVYFSVNSAFKELMEVYFFNNFFYYHTEEQGSLLTQELNNIGTAVSDNPALFLLIFAGLLFLLTTNKKIFAAISICFVTASVFYIYGRHMSITPLFLLHLLHLGCV